MTVLLVTCTISVFLAEARIYIIPVEKCCIIDSAKRSCCQSYSPFLFFMIFSICYCAHRNKSTENVSFTPPLCPCAVWKPAFPKIEIRQWVIKHSYFVLMCSLGPTSIKDYVSLITYLHPSPSFPPSLINDRTDLKGRTTINASA